MTPNDAAEVIRTAAQRFVAGEANAGDMWSAFHSNLSALCESAPLTGDFLVMFDELERWERALPAAKASAETELRTVASRLTNRS